jgi:hypothetical protein
VTAAGALWAGAGTNLGNGKKKKRGRSDGSLLPLFAQTFPNPCWITSHIQNRDDSYSRNGNFVVDCERKPQAKQTKKTMHSSVNASMKTKGRNISEYALDEVITHSDLLRIIERAALFQISHRFREYMNLAKFHQRRRRVLTSASEYITAFPERNFLRRSLKTRRCQAGDPISRPPPWSEAQRFSMAASRSGSVILSISIGLMMACVIAIGRQLV